jgi:folate-binding protein YgfZ
METQAQTDDVASLTTGTLLHGGAARELVVATGADRVAFLHRVVTGKVAGTPVGGGCRAALLTTKGHVVADLFVLVRPDDIWLVTDSGQGDPTAAALSKYAIMDDVAFTRAADFAQIAVLGPEAGACLVAAGLVPAGALPEAPLAHATFGATGEIAIVRVRELGADGYWVMGPAAAIAEARAALAAAGVPTLAPAAAEAARVVALEGRWGSEITPDYFPMEVGLTGAIDYTKGCYLGQEPIVRLRDRGHINWRLVQLEVPGGLDPAPGDGLESDAKPKAGKITSAARFPDGRTVALAMLHVSIPVGGAVRIKHGEATIGATVRQSVSDGKPAS